MPPVRTQVRISPKHSLFFVQGDLMETEEIRVKMCIFPSVMLIHVFVKFWLSAKLLLQIQNKFTVCSYMYLIFSCNLLKVKLCCFIFLFSTFLQKVLSIIGLHNRDSRSNDKFGLTPPPQKKTTKKTTTTKVSADFMQIMLNLDQWRQSVLYNRSMWCHPVWYLMTE